MEATDAIAVLNQCRDVADRINALFENDGVIGDIDGAEFQTSLQNCQTALRQLRGTLRTLTAPEGDEDDARFAQLLEAFMPYILTSYFLGGG